MAEPEPDPILRILHEIRKNVMLLAIATSFLFVVLLISVASAIYIRSNDLQNEANRLVRRTSQNREAIQLLCSVTSAFDNAILAAADQIRLSRENGTYARLIAVKILTPANVREAYRTEHNYRVIHRLLSNPHACLVVLHPK